LEIDLRASLTALLPRLRRFGLALTGSAADADDLVQAACERVLTRGEQLRDQARLDAWVYGIMRHLWIDETRARRVRRHDDIDAASHVAGEDGEQVAAGVLTLKKVRAILDGMPAEQRVVLSLVCVDGLRYADAARVLDVPIGTVMSRLARARENLRQRMQTPSAGQITPLRVVRAPEGNG